MLPFLIIYAFQATFTVIWPAEETEMAPPHKQVSMQVLLSAGILPIVTVVEPGIQGATVFGIHGAGENTPALAAVAAITAGLVGAEHMPKGIMLFIGVKSIMVAAGMLPPLTRLVGRTIMVDGATPKVHINTAPLVTNCGIFSP